MMMVDGQKMEITTTSMTSLDNENVSKNFTSLMTSNEMKKIMMRRSLFLAGLLFANCVQCVHCACERMLCAVSCVYLHDFLGKRVN